MITLKNIEKYYENKSIKNYVLRDINLTIQPGEFVSIMGRAATVRRYCVEKAA